MKVEKLRVLHSGVMSIPPMGVLNQMQWEQDAANQLDIDWRSVIYCASAPTSYEDICYVDQSAKWNFEDSLLKKAHQWLKFLRGYYRWLQEQQDQVDVYVLRYNVHDPFQAKFIKASRKPVYLVHHTLEMNELASSGGLIAKVRAVCERMIGRICLNFASGLIGVTSEILEYERSRISRGKEKAGFVYPNGIKLDKASDIVDPKDSDVPQILFVASSFAPWHGLDLLLQSMDQNKDKFVLHLVGDISRADLLVAEEDNRVVIHGRLSQEQIGCLAAECRVGLSSFALNRLDMREACTLKVREYLNLGLPVYAGYRDVFDGEALFYRQGEPSIRAILDYIQDLSALRKADIQKMASCHIDKNHLLSQLYQWLLFGFKGIS